MKTPIPEWRLTIIWFVASIFATGAFWYFLGKGSLKGAVISGIVTVALLAAAIRVSVINDRLKTEIAGRYGLPGLRDRALQIAEAIDRFAQDRLALRRDIEARGPQERELYSFDLATKREFEQRFWNDTVLLRDRIAKEFALGDPRLNSAPQSPSAIAALALALRTVAERMQ